MLFSSDFGEALGTSNAARTDGNRWNIMSDPGMGLAVVECGALGFPTPQCLEVTAAESASGFARLAKTGLGVPGVGESFYYRWYYRNEVPSTADDSTHPIESGQTGGLDWSFNVEVQSNTTWRPELRPGGDQANADRARWTGPVLQTGVTYRVELQIHKTSAMEFQAHIRVYGADGTLMASDADFNNHTGGLVPTTQMTLADSPTLHFATNGGTNLDELRAGINGLSAAPGYGRVRFAYQGGVALCAGDWCGPYAAGE